MMKQDIILTPDRDVRLLEYVRGELKNTPSGRVKSYLTHRQISVDGVVVTKFDRIVHSGQSVRILLSRRAEPESELPIIYEDDWLVAVNKPSGLLSVASDSEKERTAYRIMKKGREGRLFVVHRLDRDTSGVLLFAKSEEIRDLLQRDWGNTVRREYLAVCEGVFEQKSGRCESSLRENSAHIVYSDPSGEGKRAVTDYTVMRENRAYSFVKLLISTGRKNQIRVHMKELGHPVAGDKKYGAATNPLKRLALHASLLEIRHPVTRQPLVIRANAGRKFTLPYEKNKA
jgi:23S rRNA pseudouridine1911/1915/1917 synthase